MRNMEINNFFPAVVDKSHFEMEMSRNEKLIDLNNLIGFPVGVKSPCTHKFWMRKCF